MGIAKYVEDHPLLREIRFAALKEGEAKGRVEGKAEGKAEGMSVVIHHLLAAKFSTVPKWARTRLENATPVQLERWATKVLTAETLEQVLGKRPS